MDGLESLHRTSRPETGHVEVNKPEVKGGLEKVHTLLEKGVTTLFRNAAQKFEEFKGRINPDSKASDPEQSLPGHQIEKRKTGSSEEVPVIAQNIISDDLPDQTKMEHQIEDLSSRFYQAFKDNNEDEMLSLHTEVEQLLKEAPEGSREHKVLKDMTKINYHIMRADDPGKRKASNWGALERQSDKLFSQRTKFIGMKDINLLKSLLPKIDKALGQISQDELAKGTKRQQKAYQDLLDLPNKIQKDINELSQANSKRVEKKDLNIEHENLKFENEASMLENFYRPNKNLKKDELNKAIANVADFKNEIIKSKQADSNIDPQNEILNRADALLERLSALVKK